jgi:hypothetical protein
MAAGLLSPERGLSFSHKFFRCIGTLIDYRG